MGDVMAKIIDRFVFQKFQYAMYEAGVIFVSGSEKVGKEEIVEEIIGDKYNPNCV